MRTLTLLALLTCLGCSRPAAIESTPTAAGNKAKLEVDAGLTKEGITVTEKSRDDKKLVLVFQSAGKDHESSNYSYSLYGSDGAKLQTNHFSIPGFAKGGQFEWSVENEDLPKANRVVIHFFGK